MTSSPDGLRPPIRQIRECLLKNRSNGIPFRQRDVVESGCAAGEGFIQIFVHLSFQQAGKALEKGTVDHVTAPVPEQTGTQIEVLERPRLRIGPFPIQKVVFESWISADSLFRE